MAVSEQRESGGQQIAQLAISVAIADLALMTMVRPWEDKEMYPRLFPTYNHAVAEGFDDRL